ncbi:alpha/beta fold hydrolase [Nocardia sp. SYP-A9097]|uniref:alpha/beta hydrolase n=1 Tax=Nocardia sp. SYP-A9097 TaxID=2663237 RepID=UPI00129BE034|nr:alpha/beta fold hydrolase [Nocardia sp. SYP-A9097]MRH91115.1 alpha/beta fold hydrolase [Nocardia sp. SYP-A9097]
MPYFDGGRGRLHYRRQSVTDASARVALLPGTGQHSGHYHRFGRALENAGIELWTLDTSGHGLSEGDPDRPGTLPELAADARAFLDAIPADSIPCVLMGHSLGAATALAALDSHTAATFGAAVTLSGLILCGTPRAVLLGEPPKSARGSATTTASGRGRGVRLMGPAGPVVPEGIPVLVVHGVDDRRAPIEPVREWARHIVAEFREYPDAGHDLLHEPVHAVVSADIAEWIGKVAAR